MKDFQAYNLVELDSLEMKETNGGILLELLIGAAVGWLIYELTHKNS